MPLLYEYTGGRYAKGGVGIEIETETQNEINYPQLTYWTRHLDGSLRYNGIEFVLSNPLDFKSKQYAAAIAEFAEVTKGRKYVESVYSSVHVHLNMSQKQMIHIVNFVCLYLLSEEILGKYCGPDRNGNLFCLKTSSAEGNLNSIIRLFNSWTQSVESGWFELSRLSQANLKYAGLNIAPLRTLGSIEVRTHGPTVDVEKIDRWVGILSKLSEKAETYRDPHEILGLFRDGAKYKWFFEHLFGSYTQYLDLTNLDKEMREPLWYMSQISSIAKDWSTLGDMTETPKKKSAYVDFAQNVTLQGLTGTGPAGVVNAPRQIRPARRPVQGAMPRGPLTATEVNQRAAETARLVGLELGNFYATPEDE